MRFKTCLGDGRPAPTAMEKSRSRFKKIGSFSALIALLILLIAAARDEFPGPGRGAVLGGEQPPN